MHFDGAALGRTLNTESKALGAFIALLRDEQHALVRGDLERLASYAESKRIHLFELTRLGEQRLQWLSEQGLTADRTGMDRLLREHTARTPQARAAWEQLINLTRTAQQLNDTNGNLIRTRLTGAQRALSVLLSAAHIAGAYAPDGSTVCYRAPQRLAVA